MIELMHTDYDFCHKLLKWKLSTPSDFVWERADDSIELFPRYLSKMTALWE
jgi:hypothetical protein